MKNQEQDPSQLQDMILPRGPSNRRFIRWYVLTSLFLAIFEIAFLLATGLFLININSLIGVITFLPAAAWWFIGFVIVTRTITKNKEKWTEIAWITFGMVLMGEPLAFLAVLSFSTFFFSANGLLVIGVITLIAHIACPLFVRFLQHR